MSNVSPEAYGTVTQDEWGQPRVGDWIQTHRKIKFHPGDPKPADVDIRDIAHALSNLCRYTGHTGSFYSVAEHSVRVALLCPPEDRLWGLMHDAAEAYIGDLNRPTKMLPEMAPYRHMEANIMRVICEKFCIPAEPPPSVKRADEILLATEARDLMSPLVGKWILREKPGDFSLLWPWTVARSELIFLGVFRELMVEVDPSMDLTRSGETDLIRSGSKLLQATAVNSGINGLKK